MSDAPKIAGPERLRALRAPLTTPEQMTLEQFELIGVDPNGDDLGLAELSLVQLVIGHRRVAKRLIGNGTLANLTNQLPDRDRELMILRISWLYQSAFEWGQHYEQAVEAGVSREQAELVKVGPDAPEWSDWDRALLVATDGLVSDAMIPTSAWDVLTTRYTTEMLLELIVFFGHYTIVSMFANTFGLPVTPGRPDFDGRIAD